MTEKLRAMRHLAGAFDARFHERHPDFWPIGRAAATFAERADWPAPEEYGAAFAIARPPVRFETQPPKRRRPPGPVDRGALYDARIVLDGVVPTRARMWHDYLNALVWATFPRAKLALHRRQHAAVQRWIPDGARCLPNARTREMDALALVDEGGVLVLDDAPILFGHALFEGLALGQPAMVPCAVPLAASAPAGAAAASRLEIADVALATMLADTSRFLSPDELPRRPVAGNA